MSCPKDIMSTAADGPALEVRGLSKSFRAVRALDDLTMQLYRHRVTALLGDNGAGKSTLVKCVAGLFQPDRGEIRVEGEPQQILSPESARGLGIETVFQNLALIDTLDVADNLFLNRELVGGRWVGRWLKWAGWVDRRRMRRECAEILAKFEVELPSQSQLVSNLSGGQRQAIAISRAAAWGQKIVMLDEPAAALGVEQTARVLELIRNLRDRGVAVLLVTHNMERVLEVCDQVVVLRQGKKVAEIPVSSTSKEELIAYIAGSKRMVFATDG